MKPFLNFLLLILIAAKSYSQGPAVNNHIKIDQFGYRPLDKKIAVISNPITGYNNNSPFTPGNNYQVRKMSDNSVAYSGAISSWNGGATHSQSGDKVWWFEFTSLSAQGTYYVYDVSNNVRSYQFEIDDNVYLNTLKQAMRVFYYQRCGTPKAAPYAENGWTDSECHKGSMQDLDCRLYNNNDPSTSKNLFGGWHDAGDYNKYVNFTFEPVTDLLLGYREHPSIWGDNYNIPESGNGIPDILDETRYELEWLLRMQNNDGSVLCMVGVRNNATGSPPSSDHAQRLYGPATTSASLTASALFALGAIQFNAIGQSSFASALQTASVNAWNWANANPSVTFYNSGVIGAGEQEVDQYGTLSRKMAAAVFLYALTNNATYKTFFDNNYTQMHMIQWNFAYPFEAAQQNMMLYYSSLPGATPSAADAVKNAYRNSMKNSSENLPAYTNQTDPYRAFLADQNYVWGSNTVKGREGIMYHNMIFYKLDTASNTNYSNAGLGYLNYLNGINPTAFCYLTKMSNHGAENSVTKIFHAWFDTSFADGPPPGFVTGGPNPQYALDGCCPSGCGSSNSMCNTSAVTPPLSQPIQKAYKDWNAGWPQNSWTITEPAIYTQAAYARLVSQFVVSASLSQIKIIIQGFYDQAINKMRMKDTVRIYMRNVSSPYNLVDSASSTVDSISFRGNYSFTNLPSGTYYVVAKHRNSIETWSKQGGEVYVSGSSFMYDFTPAISAAYGNNMVEVNNTPSTYAIYNGDVFREGTIDLTDIIIVFNDASNFVSGYAVSDVTGNRFVDLSDLTHVYNNSNAFVRIIRP